MPEERLFFSYLRIDSEIALKLATDLRDAGANLWLDQLDIPAGERWDSEIEKALEACNCLLFIASRASIVSRNALNELNFALEEERRVIPVKIDDCKLPYRIRTLQFIDISQNYNLGFKNLLKALTLESKAEFFPFKLELINNISFPQEENEEVQPVTTAD